MVKKSSEKRQHGDSRRQKMRSSLDVPSSTSRSGTPSSSRLIHADAFQKSSPHKSFKRTYREDYVRELDVPGMGQHIYESFTMIFQHWKLFLPLLLLSMILEVLAVNTTYETTAVFSVLIFLMIWLVTIFLVRHIKAGHEVSLRDGLYNAMTPLLSSLVVFVVAVIECIPIFLVIIAYSAAIKTEFLTMPFSPICSGGASGLRE